MPDVSNRHDAKTVIGFFEEESDAERAIQDMKEVGIPSSRIGVSFDGPANSGTDFKTHESFWQKIGAFFTGEQQPKANTSPIGFGHVPSTMIARFNEKLRSGGVLVSVNALTAQETQEIEDILEEHDGEIETATLAPSAGINTDQVGEQRIHLLSEILRVQKERVPRGEVRLRKEVVTENQNIEVPVTREELVIERVAGDGQPATGPVGVGKELRVPLSEERVTVDKKPVVAEEVRVGKRVVSDTKQVSDNVRREELKIDKEGDVPISEQQKQTKRKVG